MIFISSLVSYFSLLDTSVSAHIARLLELLEQEDQLHPHVGEAATVGSVEAAVTQESSDESLVSRQPFLPAGSSGHSRLEVHFFIVNHVVQRGLLEGFFVSIVGDNITDRQT